MRRAAWPLVLSAVVVGVLFLGVFPTRTFLAQRRAIDAAERRVTVLTQQNQQLAARVERLNTDEEIERLAREQYNLVRPGEEAYAILPAPAPQPSSALEPPAPAGADGDRDGFWARLGATLTFWD